MVICLISSMLLIFLYTLYVHFIYTKRTLAFYLSGDGCDLSVGKCEFVGRKVEVWTEESPTLLRAKSVWQNRR